MITEGFEVTSGSSAVSLINQVCFKIGNRVCIGFTCRVSSEIPTIDTPLAIIPMEYRPKADISITYGILGMEKGVIPRFGLIRIFSDNNHPHGLIGQMLVPSIPSGTTITFMFEYYI